MTQAIPAATLILWRQASGEQAELLMMERAATMAFAAGAMVFPGGRVDPGDHAMAAGLADAADAAARIAAIRETIEEVGVAPGIAPAPDPATVERWRAALSAGGGLAALLQAGGYRLDLEALIPFARWKPNFNETRTFDTRFYLAEAPADAIASVDGTEGVHLVWTTPAALIAEADAGRRHIIFPTRRNLERLAALPDFAAARAHAAAYPIRTITPWIEQRDGADWLCIPDDAGYPVTAQTLASVRRG